MTGCEPTCGTAGAVAGLAREVEALRRAVDGVRELPARLDELARVVAQVAEAASARAAQQPAVVVSWLDLPPGVREARRLLGELLVWMQAVYLRYADAAAHLPACWLWHPDVVEELIWLRQAWCAAYRDSEATSARAGDWHDRYRPGVVKRIKSVAGTCSLENHLPREPELEAGAAPVAPLADAAEQIAAWWGSTRHAAPPVPDDDQVAAVATRRSPRGRR